MFRSRLEDIAERRGERINPATQILQIDEDDIACIHHLICRLAHFAIQTKHGDAVYWIVEVRRLDHVVLLVTTQAMLRAERRGDLYVAACGQRIERVRKVCRDRGGMRKARPAMSRSMPNSMVGTSGNLKRKAIGMMKIRLARRMSQRPI